VADVCFESGNSEDGAGRRTYVLRLAILRT
jgi:hypothetical protein